jgi:hypothetical protein
MRRFGLLFLLLTLVSCGPKTPAATSTPAPTHEITEKELAVGALMQQDVGNVTAWKPQTNPQPDTFQIGGRVGSATFITHASAEVTVAFAQQTGSGFVSNTVYALPTVAEAQAVMTAQNQADQIKTWRQQRNDGGYLDAKKIGGVTGLDTLGDDMYTARLEVNVRPKGSAVAVKRGVDYVAFRIGRIMSFVVAQDAPVKAFAEREEARLAHVEQ